MRAAAPTPSLAPLDLTPVHAALHRYQTLETELSALLLERDDVVRAALVALLARQHMVILGKPGTAKSMLIEQLAARISPSTGGGLQTFVWLMTRFTTPEELFGPISVTGLKTDDYRRITTNKLPEAELVFLDEIFKASSSIGNALLTLLNERKFDNGSTRINVPLISLFGASNEMPQGEDTAALWDRMGLRVQVEYVSETGFAKLLRHTAAMTAPTCMPQLELVALQEAIKAMPIPDVVIQALIQLRKELKGKGIEASDRRWRQSLDLIRAHALIEGRGMAEEDDLTILRDALWHGPEQRQEIGRMVARLANPLVGQAVEEGDRAATVYQAVMDAQGQGTPTEQMTAAVEGNTKLKQSALTLKRMIEQAQSQGRSTSRIERVIQQVDGMRQEVAMLIL